MKKNIYLVLGVVIIVVVAILLLGGKSASQKTGTILIGAPLSLTGAASVDGQNIKKGLDLAVEDLAKKGINVQIAYEDDATDPKQTVSAVQKILATSNPEAFVGLTWAYLEDAAGPIINKAQIATYAPANTSELLTTKSNYYFFGSTKVAGKETPIANWLKENGKKRVAIISSKDTWGDVHVAMFTAAAKAAGTEVVLTEQIPFSAESEQIPTVITKVLASKADVILFTGYEQGNTILMKRMQERGSPIPVIMASEIPHTLLKNGTITANANDKFYLVTMRPSEAFSAEFTAKYNQAPGTYADRAYDGLMLLVDAIQHKATNQSVADYLHTTTNYKGYATTYKFDQNGDIVGGEWVVDKLQ